MCLCVCVLTEGIPRAAAAAEEVQPPEDPPLGGTTKENSPAEADSTADAGATAAAVASAASPSPPLPKGKGRGTKRGPPAAARAPSSAPSKGEKVVPEGAAKGGKGAPPREYQPGKAHHHLKVDVCKYCYESGHWARGCPKLALKAKARKVSP